jgi:LysM repeat protein
MSNLDPKLLYIGNEDDGTVYSVSSNVGSYAIIRNINFCNTSNTDTVFTMHLVPTGTAGANNKIISNIKVPANDVVVSDATYVINAGGSLYAFQPTSNVTVAVSGAEYITGA